MDLVTNRLAVGYLRQSVLITLLAAYPLSLVVGDY